MALEVTRAGRGDSSAGNHRASGTSGARPCARGGRWATALGSLAVGALAAGALAIGALAIGRLAVGALAMKRARIRSLTVEELEVGRLRVLELVVDNSGTRPPDAATTPG